MKVRFRAAIEFNDPRGLVFDRFLPLVESSIPVPLGQTGFQIAICVDPERHRRWISDIALDALDNHRGLNVAGLYILLDTDVEHEVVEALKESLTSAATRTLGERVVAAIESAHDSLVEFVRSENEQFWLPARRDIDTSLQQRLLRYDTRWLTDEGWKLLRAHPDAVLLESNLLRGVTPEGWATFRDALQRGHFRARPHRRLLANAFALHSRHDLRAAVIEGVAAWEMVLSNDAVTRLVERRACFDHNAWTQIIEKAGLRASSHLFFALAADLPAVGKRREEVLEAIELRNNVVHNGQHRLEHRKVGDLLRAIRQVVFACETP